MQYPNYYHKLCLKIGYPLYNNIAYTQYKREQNIDAPLSGR
ncbi:hypothetical protein ykris0001_39240 [Yersinia kristensenii ATCC 33638]|nr:hypothetical protein ykris0001_39240 [Yersinia kristensenii ATCC 33638]